MKATEHRFTWNGDEYRVVVADDVVSIPGHAGAPGWSMGGFGGSISEEWLLHEGRLPGTRPKQRALATMIRRALAAHHASAVPLPPCVLCGLGVGTADRVVGQASGPHGVILHDDEIAHASCLEARR